MNVVSVRFLGGCKTYYFDPGELSVAEGQDVIVETSQGVEYASCVEGNHEVPEEAVVSPLCPVLRIATENDRRTLQYNQEREKEAMAVCQKKIVQHGLDMKLVNVSCGFDGNKIIFFFTSDGRVDFRDLVKDLASVFRARIELRQIGVRDEAKMLGGLGICGRPFCCSQFLDSFMPVSIKMAKTQSLSLNPTKISGTCGRLMCCLKYEQGAYEDAARRMPKNDSFVLTPDGPGNICSVNLLRETAKVSLDSASDGQRCYHNCELCVLRNGKGSREGIEIPAQRPARYVEERPEEDGEAIPPLVCSAPAAATEGVAEKRPEKAGNGGGGNRRRNRSGRVTHIASRVEEPAEKRPEKGEKPPRSAEKKPERPAAPAGGEGEKQASRRRRPHHRGGRRRGGEGGAAPQAE